MGTLLDSSELFFIFGCRSSKLVQQIFSSSILRIAEMHSTSLRVGYPRSPFKFTAFINALLFLCHASGLKLFPEGSVLLRPSSNAGLLPSSNAALCIRAPMPDYVCELQRRTVYPSSNAEIYPSSNAGLCPGSNAGLYLRCHITLVQKS